MLPVRLTWIVRSGLTAGLVVLLAACAPAAPPASGGPVVGSGAVSAPAAAPARTLVMAIRVEPASVASKTLGSGGVTLTTTRRLFNVTLAMFDDQGLAVPYLAATLPRLDTPSWVVASDGRMETTYQLMPNLVWHDGQPLTASDFVFAWRVYATTELGVSGVVPFPQIEEVVAPDATTVLIRWRRAYAEAGVLNEGLPPLPRHLLESAFQGGGFEAFAGLPHWTREYVGAGPYRLDRWDPGSAIEAVAFDQHVLGRAKIERIRIVFIGDPNAALANILGGDVHFSADDSIRFQQGLVLKREWGPRAGGSVLAKPDLWRATYVQLRSDQMSPRVLADVRVRRALAHAIDKTLLNEGLFEGDGIMADVPLIPPTASYFASVERAATKYPFDLRRSEQLLLESGLSRGGDGIWTSAADGRLNLDLKTNGSAQNEAELSILGADLRRAGFEVRENVVPPALAQDGQVRNSFPSLYTFSTPLGEENLAGHNVRNTPRAENRWVGMNRGAWASPEFDQISDAFNSTLDVGQREQRVVDMIRIFSSEVPALSLHFNPIPMAHIAALTGPKLVAPEAAVAWNVHQWEFR